MCGHSVLPDWSIRLNHPAQKTVWADVPYTVIISGRQYILLTVF